MIAKTHRFHGINSLRTIYTRGQTVRGPLMAVRFLANPRRGSYRAAVVVSRKVHKSAVTRNRIRRRIYEIIRRHAQEITQPYDIVVTVFSDQIAMLDAAALEMQLVGQLKKAGVLSGKHGGPPKMTHAIVESKERP